MRWTRKSIIAEISRLHEAGERLNYSAAENNHLNLVRAAAWHFGTWRHAVESAGVNYESLSRYQRWSKARIVERIRELHNDGQDLSWRAVSNHVDQPLAAAALRPNGFTSWREALTAAGIDAENATRYKHWDKPKVLAAIRARKRTGAPMSSKSLQTSDQCLFCAARRRFGSWDAALEAAGYNSEKIRLRRHNATPAATPNPKKKTKEKPVVAAPKKAVKVAAIKTPAKKAVVPKAAPTKAVPIKVVPTKAVPTKAVPTKAVPAKVAATKTAPVKVAAKKAVVVSSNGKAKTPVKIETKTAAKNVAVPKLPVAKTIAKPTATKTSVAKPVAKKAAKVEVVEVKAAAKKTAAKKAPAKRAAR